MEEKVISDGAMKKKRVKSVETKEKDRIRAQNWRKNKKQKKEELKKTLKDERVLELERERDGLKEEVVYLKSQLLKSDFYLESLRNEVKEKNKMLEEFEIKWKVMNTIAENSKRLVNDLAPNSPYRRPLLAYLVTGLAKRTAMDYFQISKRTLERILGEEGNNLLEVKYTVNVQRKRITDEQKEEIKRILDDILPKQSGREWRTQEETDKRVYEKYLAAVQKGKGVSKSFFIYTILKDELIHHSDHPSFCKLCEQYESGDKDPNLIKHKELIPIQRGQYTKEKLVIGNGDKHTALVTQDFTQIQYDGGFTQDLIICIYTYNNEEADGLQRVYRHFVGKSDDQNGVSFVIGCWKVLLDEKRLDEVQKVNIWSDGGPKHFKISSNIKFLLSLQQARPHQAWSYNFFPSYHGCSVCDAAASHIKQKVNQEQRDKQKAIRTPQQVVEVGNQLNNHEVSMAAITTIKLKSNTLHGIKQFHKFTTSREKNVIFAFSDSTQSEYTRKYYPRDVIPLDDYLV
jgi:hypothetical protein